MTSKDTKIAANQVNSKSHNQELLSTKEANLANTSMSDDVLNAYASKLDLPNSNKSHLQSAVSSNELTLHDTTSLPLKEIIINTDFTCMFVEENDDTSGKQIRPDAKAAAQLEAFLNDATIHFECTNEKSHGYKYEETSDLVKKKRKLEELKAYAPNYHQSLIKHQQQEPLHKNVTYLYDDKNIDNDCFLELLSSSISQQYRLRPIYRQSFSSTNYNQSTFDREPIICGQDNYPTDYSKEQRALTKTRSYISHLSASLSAIKIDPSSTKQFQYPYIAPTPIVLPIFKSNKDSLNPQCIADKNAIIRNSILTNHPCFIPIDKERFFQNPSSFLSGNICFECTKRIECEKEKEQNIQQPVAFEKVAFAQPYVGKSSDLTNTQTQLKSENKQASSYSAFLKEKEQQTQDKQSQKIDENFSLNLHSSIDEEKQRAKPILNLGFMHESLNDVKASKIEKAHENVQSQNADKNFANPDFADEVNLNEQESESIDFNNSALSNNETAENKPLDLFKVSCENAKALGANAKNSNVELLSNFDAIEHSIKQSMYEDVFAPEQEKSCHVLDAPNYPSLEYIALEPNCLNHNCFVEQFAKNNPEHADDVSTGYENSIDPMKIINNLDQSLHLIISMMGCGLVLIAYGNNYRRRIVWANQAFYQITGHTKEEYKELYLKGESYKIIHPDDLHDVFSVFDQQVRDHKPLHIRYRALHKNTNEYVWCDVKSSYVGIFDGMALFVNIVNDITEDRRMQDQMERWMRKTQLLSEACNEIVYEYDVNTDTMEHFGGYHLYITPQERIMPNFLENLKKGKNAHVYPEDIKTVSDMLSSKEWQNGCNHKEIKFRMCRLNNVFRWHSSSATCYIEKSSGHTKIIGKIQDVHELQSRIETLNQENRLDNMTLLLNKKAFKEDCIKILQKSNDALDCHAMMMIDIDNFKNVNDTHGHAFGDEVIKMVAACLKCSFKSSDLVARMGGDEFVVLMKSTNLEQACQRVMMYHQLIEYFGKKLSIPYPVTSSVGIAFYPMHAFGYSDLYNASDEALYKVKRSVKGGFAIYGKPINQPYQDLNLNNSQGTQELIEVKALEQKARFESAVEQTHILIDKLNRNVNKI